MLQNNKIKIFSIYIILFFLIILHYKTILYNFTLNENILELEKIINLVEKFLNPENIPILNKEEKIIAKYWEYSVGENLLCPFSKLISHGLTKEEALFIIDFFNIEDIKDLKKLNEFIKNIKK